MSPTIEELQKQIQVLQQDLSFARDDASQQRMKYEDARETLRDRIMLALLAGGAAVTHTPAQIWDSADIVLGTRKRTGKYDGFAEMDF